MSEWNITFEPPHDKTNKMACTPSEDSGHPSSLIKVFVVPMKKAWVLSYLMSTQWRLWSDWADAQADSSLRWAQLFSWFCHEVAHFLLEVAQMIQQHKGLVTFSFNSIPVTEVKFKHMSHVMIKPAFAICKQQRRRSACTSAQSDKHLCCLLLS